jgi:hypothetical protein
VRVGVRESLVSRTPLGKFLSKPASRLPTTIYSETISNQVSHSERFVVELNSPVGV